MTRKKWRADDHAVVNDGTLECGKQVSSSCCIGLQGRT